MCSSDLTAPELGHPLIDDNHDRPLHPLVGPFLREYLSRHEDMDDDDNEMGHLYTGLGDTRVLARTMLEDWETKPAVYDDDQSETVSKCHPRRNRERFRLCTQQEILTKFKRLNSRARIYRA